MDGTERDDRSSGDDDGGFEFGSEPRPVSEESTVEESPDRRRTENSERRIKVDLRDGSTQRERSPDATDAVGRGGRGPGRGPAPGAGAGPNALRNWTVLLALLGLTSFVTAIVALEARDASIAATGASLLGVVFLVAALAARRFPAVADVLSAGWIEHRRTTWFSIGLFAFGIVIGGLLLALGVDLFEFVFEMLEEEFEELVPEDPEADEAAQIEFTATFFIANNSIPFLMTIVGALSVGMLTLAILVFNGVIVGNLGAAMAGLIGIDYVVLGLAPHGIFELAAIFLGAAVGFRIVSRFAERIAGRRDAFFTRAYLSQTAALVVFAWLLLVLAAFVEAYVTPELLEFFFAEQLEGESEEPGLP
ncbi:stage II sporulation protein M [Natrarchaeobaculum aegyptiacum]|nr:stage II sporulation protein M [Natrarchaeobaculum aegyptiacum]